MRHFSGSACPRWTQYETLPTRIVPPPDTLVKVYRKEVFTWRKRKNARTA
nr:MAG TPA: hypothetical protein [Caudoviricetes sp.]